MRPESRLRRPRLEDLPQPLARVARAIGARLGAAGHQAWLVGGAVRDLALGRSVSEVDLATDARPERIEALFEHTVAVGKAFGTVIVVLEGADVEVTTFRSESGYSDARRPDRVSFGASVEEDARRRDFTCNALFLEPNTGELRDPEGGLADLEAGLLRTVGEARERFAEDGLRLLRMARFAAQLGLEPGPGLVEAARSSAHALRGVSAERVRGELERIFEGPAPARALDLLVDCALLERVLPALASLEPSERERRLARLRAVGAAPGAAAGFALLLDAARAPEAARESLESLRASRRLYREVLELGRLLAGLAHLAEDPPRSACVRLARSPAYPRASGALRPALEEAQARGLASLEARLGASPGALVLHPEPLLSSEDLAASGLEPGRGWRELLLEAESAQLDGLFATRAQALAWLAERLRDPQLGGKRRRKANEKG